MYRNFSLLVRLGNIKLRVLIYKRFYIKNTRLKGTKLAKVQKSFWANVANLEIYKTW